MGAQYNEARWRYFEKTGCLVTADVTADDKICPEGAKNYKFTGVQPATAVRENAGDEDEAAPERLPPDADSGSSGADTDDDADDADDEASTPVMFADALRGAACSDGFALACEPFRPDMQRTTVIGRLVAYRCAHSGWGVFAIRTYASAEGANFTLRSDNGDDRRANLAAAAYAVGADGSASVMEALKPGSWLLLAKRRTGGGGAAAAGPVFIALGRGAAGAPAAAP
jgi:hypothetical protein